MTERIDHAAQALAYLHPESYQPEKAQVHATLALVEQQRISNLIALWNLSNASKFNLLTSAGVDPEAPDESATVILRGLGLS